MNYKEEVNKKSIILNIQGPIISGTDRVSGEIGVTDPVTDRVPSMSFL